MRLLLYFVFFTIGQLALLSLKFDEINTFSFFKITGSILVVFFNVLLLTPIFLIILKFKNESNIFKIVLNYVIIQRTITFFPVAIMMILFYITEIYVFFFLAILLYAIFLLYLLIYVPWNFYEKLNKKILFICVSLILFFILINGLQAMITNPVFNYKPISQKKLLSKNFFNDKIGSEFLHNAYPMLLEYSRISLQLNNYIIDLDSMLNSERKLDSIKTNKKLTRDYLKIEQLINQWNLNKKNYINRMKNLKSKSQKLLNESSFSITKRCLKEIIKNAEQNLELINIFDKFINKNKDLLIKYDKKSLSVSNNDSLKEKIRNEIKSKSKKEIKIMIDKLLEKTNSTNWDNSNLKQTEKYFIKTSDGYIPNENFYNVLTNYKFKLRRINSLEEKYFLLYEFNIIENKFRKTQKKEDLLEYFNYLKFITQLYKKIPFYILVPSTI